MSYSDIQSSLTAKWVSVNATITGGALTTIYPNTRATPPSTRWAQVFMLANQPFVGSLGPNGADEIFGIFQIDLHVPLGEGSAVLNQIFDTIRSEFKAGSVLTYNAQETTILSCGMSPPEAEETFYKGSVRIEWESRLYR